MDYRAAGVDVEAGRQFVSRIKDMVAQTHRPGVLGGLGGFGGLFEIPEGYKQPVLVSGTDGVGTKLKLAHQLDRHDSVGIDLVAMCVNDVLTCGAEPLFFLDYIATGKLNEDQLAGVVSGIAEGCKLSGCALSGGETAEMPGFYGEGEYDLAGFCVAIVEKSKIIDGSAVAVGDAVIALPSSGVHSNGYSLVRKIVETQELNWTDKVEAFGEQTLGDVFLTPTQLYVKPVLEALKQPWGEQIHAMAHNTGGGLPENLPRCLAEGTSIQIDVNSWERSAVFRWLQEAGDVGDRAMFETFNMGVGYVVIVPQALASDVTTFFQNQGLAAWQVGEVVAGEGEVLGLPQ